MPLRHAVDATASETVSGSLLHTASCIVDDYRCASLLVVRVECE